MAQDSVYPNVLLQEAQDKRRLAKKQLEQGFDPAETKELAKLERQASGNANLLQDLRRGFVFIPKVYQSPKSEYCQAENAVKQCHVALAKTKSLYERIQKENVFLAF